MIAIGQWLASAPDVPRLERELLLCDLLELSRAQIIAHPEQPLDDDDVNKLNNALLQLRSGTPYAYVVGHREFWGLSLKVTSDVLIPRPETELLVELAVMHCPRDGRILDLGTGSGAIAIAIATERPDLKVHATDRSTAALRIAQDNARQHQVDITFHNGYWFDALPPDSSFDMLVSNPPYIAPGDTHLPALQHEPATALVAAADGLADLALIVAQAPRWLNIGGMLAVEHGHDQAIAVQDQFRQADFLEVHSKADLAGIDRVTLGIRGR